MSDVEDDDDGELSDDGKGKRRKKKKKKDAVGPVNTLPSVTYDKRKKRKSRGSKGNLVGAEESDGEGSESDSQATDKVVNFLHPLSLVLIASPSLAIGICGSINSQELYPSIFTAFRSASFGSPWVCPARFTEQQWS